MKPMTAALLLAAALGQALPAPASQHDPAGHPAAAGPEQTAWSEGTIRQVNADTGKVTIAHGPLVNLDMPAMTMVFRVKDPAWLAALKTGDRVRFVAERINGILMVTAVQGAR